MAPLDSRYYQVGFNLTFVQVCCLHHMSQDRGERHLLVTTEVILLSKKGCVIWSPVCFSPLLNVWLYMAWCSANGEVLLCSPDS